MVDTEENSRNSIDMDEIRVLCVDDDPDFASLVSNYLEQTGETFSTKVETCAEAALARVNQAEFDCIVSDYQMPQMDGLELLENIRASHGDLPFVLLTGRGSEAVASQAVSAGVDSYLTKSKVSEDYSVLAEQIKECVHERRVHREEQRLREEYKMVADVSADIFFFQNFRGGSQWVSDGVERYGYDADEIQEINEWWVNQIHPDDRSRIEQRVDRLAGGDETAFDRFEDQRGYFTTEYRWETAEGDYIHCRGRGMIVFGTEGPEKLVGTMTDITEEKERKAEIQRLNHELNTLLDTVPAHVYMVSLDGEILLTNEYAEDQLGEGLEGEYLEDVFPEEVNEAFEPVINESIENGTLVENEYTLRIDGEDRVIRAYIAPMYDDGDPYAFCGISVDITDHKHREERLERQTERLRTIATILSHDIRNPLTVAIGFLDAIENDIEDADERVAKIRDAHDRIEQIVDEVLDLAKGGDTTEELVELETVANQAWRMVDTDDATLNIESSTTIEADASQLQRVFENLYRNAIEHGGSAVSVGLLEEDGFYIADNGPGIPPDEREKIFETGYTTNSDGTGLGLAIVAHIIDAHGWAIEVTESEAGGAQFEVRDLNHV